MKWLLVAALLVMPAAQEQSNDEAIKTWALKFQDGPEPVEHESPEFRFFVDLFAGKLTPQEATARAASVAEARTLIEHPDDYRGKFVRLRGQMVQLATERLSTTTTHGVHEVYVGYLQTYPDRRTVCFYLSESPRGPDGTPITFKTYRKGNHEYIDNWVTVEGVFLRTWEYLGRALRPGEAPPKVDSAVLFVKNISLSDPPPAAGAQKSFVALVAIGGGAVIVVILLVGILSRRRSGESLREKRLALRRQKAAAAPQQPVGNETEKPHP